MYELEHPIPTIIETNNNESYEGIPFKIENDMIYVNQDEQIIEIKLDDIKDAIILKILIGVNYETKRNITTSYIFT